MTELAWYSSSPMWEYYVEPLDDDHSMYCCRRPKGSVYENNPEYPWGLVYVCHTSGKYDVSKEAVKCEGPLDQLSIMYHMREKYKG